MEKENQEEDSYGKKQRKIKYLNFNKINDRNY